MDITQKFKASVMTVKLQRKSELSSSSAQQQQDKNHKLPKSTRAATVSARQNDVFACQAKDICKKITTLRNVLLENRTAYMRIGQHLKNAAQMTDEQRDLIDRESEKFVTFYTQHLAQLRADWKRVKRKPQEQAHIEAVLDLLVNYLHSVQQIYLDQKKYRVQHELETYRLLKLAADKKKIPVRPATSHMNGNLHRQHSGDDVSDSKVSDQDIDDSWNWGADNDDTGDDDEHEFHDHDNDNNDSGVVKDRTASSAAVKLGANNTRQPVTQQQHLRNRRAKLQRNTDLKAKSSQVAMDEDLQKSQEQQIDDDDETQALNPEDVQMFEQENMQLYQELQGLNEEVEQIGKNVVDIAQLQDIFTEKVSLQQHNIERIANAVVGATENVKDANEQIRQATQRNAGIRVWSLFFLLVMSFSLLFLDWYYD